MDNQKFLELTVYFIFVILPVSIAAISSISLARYILSVYREKRSNKDINK